MSDVFLVCHGVLVLTDRDHVRQKFLTRRTPLIEKITPRYPQFLRFLNSNRVCLSNEAENHLSDGSEISDIMGGSLEIPFVLVPSPGSFESLFVELQPQRFENFWNLAPNYKLRRIYGLVL